MTSATSLTHEQVLSALRPVTDPVSGKDIVTAGLVGGIVIRGAKLGFALELPPGWPGDAEELRRQSELALRKQLGEGFQIAVLLTTERPPQQPDRAVAKASQWVQDPIPGVARVIAVASGKGGVGKSTTCINLAFALQAQGQRVGLIDADIHGPSLPLMLGTAGRQPEVEDGMLQPITAHGMPTLSMGNLTPGDGPVVWRGSMVTKALKQMLRATHWGELDILLIDMPPGTGDIVLTLAQSVPLDGAVIVSTPQEAAWIDARKALQTFEKLQVPILGVIENMSWYEDPASGHRAHIFGESRATREAARFHTELLAQIPMMTDIRAQCDAGVPLRFARPDHPAHALYDEAARRMRGRFKLAS